MSAVTSATARAVVRGESRSAAVVLAVALGVGPVRAGSGALGYVDIYILPTAQFSAQAALRRRPHNTGAAMSKEALAARLQEIRQKAESFVAQRKQFDEADKEGEKIYAAYMNKVFEAKAIREARDIAANEHWKKICGEEAECREQLRAAALLEIEQQSTPRLPAATPIVAQELRPGSTRRGVGSGDPMPPAETSDDDSWGGWTATGMKDGPKKKKQDDTIINAKQADRTLVIHNVFGMHEKDLTKEIRLALGIRLDWGQADTTARVNYSAARRTAFVRFDTKEECNRVTMLLDGARNPKSKAGGKGKC